MKHLKIIRKPGGRTEVWFDGVAQNDLMEYRLEQVSPVVAYLHCKHAVLGEMDIELESSEDGLSGVMCAK